MAGLFGTSGARGKTNVEITADLAFGIASSYGALLQKELNERPRVVVGHDQRHGASMLANAAAAGFQSVGADVVMVGCVSTGVYTVSLRDDHTYDGGVLITGSHMPPERIGIIPMLRNGHYADRDVTDRIEASVATRDFEQDRVSFDCIGEINNRTLGADVRYLNFIYDQVRDREAVEQGQFRVLLDPGNGTGGSVANSLMGLLNCQVTAINEHPYPIPVRPSECTPENCSEAIRCVCDGDFHLGACFDGDADRVKFITRTGDMLSDDVVAAIFVTHILDDDETYVTPVNASGLVRWAVQNRGGHLVECRIGQPSTDTAVRAHRAAMASESNAGKFGFRELECCYDGPLALAKMIEIMAQTNKSLAELAAELPQFYQASVRIAVQETRKAIVVKTATEAVVHRLKDEILRTDETDGTKLFLDGERWLLLRPSGTEPVVRAYSDAQSQEAANALISLAKAAFESACAE